MMVEEVSDAGTSALSTSTLTTSHSARRQMTPSSSGSRSTQSVPSTAETNTLPPCRVCGEKASGFHYGVNTCEACKGFFRRSLHRRQKYKCLGSGNCKMGVGRRSNCPSCRYTKCLSVGMSKDAIKTGRYTHEKRTQDILEVKQMQQTRFQTPPTLSPVHEPRSPNVESQSSPAEELIQVLPTEKTTALGLVSLEPESVFISVRNAVLSEIGAKSINPYSISSRLSPQQHLPMTPSSTSRPASPRTWSPKAGTSRDVTTSTYVHKGEKCTSDLQGAHQCQSNIMSPRSSVSPATTINTMTSHVSSVSSVGHISPPVSALSPPIIGSPPAIGLPLMTTLPPLQHESTSMPPTPPEDPVDLDATIALLVESHKKYIVSHTFSDLDALHERQVKYHEAFQEKEAMFGSLSTLPQDQYMDIFNTTGIDVDNRQEMIAFLASQMEGHLKRYISFVKTIPGFTDLPLDDQAALVKATRHEFWFWGSFHSYNSELQVISLPNGVNLHFKEMCKIWDHDFVAESFRMADTLRKLQLLPEECILVKCMCVMFADRCDLKDHGRVESIHWRITQCLIHLLDKNHPEDTTLFAKVIGRLTELRSLTEWNLKIARDLKIWPAIQRNPLIVEMLSI